MAKNILVILAHPDISKSKNNAALKAAISDLPNVTVHELYAAYPDGKINVAAEQALLEKADAVVLQFPFQWYSSPALLKEWEDKVLLYGWAYGPGGDKLKDKDFMVAITAYGPLSSYNPSGSNHFTLEHLLAPLQQTALFCQMNYKLHFALTGVASLTDEQLGEKAAEYRALLQKWED